MTAQIKPAAGSDGPAVPERRVASFPLENLSIRKSGTGDGSLHLQGHAAVFNKLSHNLGGFREKIDKGAFATVLSEDPDVHLVVGHDMNRVLARTRSKTLELREDPAGLHVWARLDPEDVDVKALLPKMRRGDVDQMSFAFTVGRDTWVIEGDADDEEVTRTIHAVDGLFDVSVVAQGAYPQTDANLRGLLEAAIESGRLVRETVTEQQDDEAPQVDDLAADVEAEPLVDDDQDEAEERTTAEAEPPAGAHNEGLDALKAHARQELELAKRRLLAAQRKGD